MSWSIKRVEFGSKEVEVLLKEGWEPFGVSPHDTSYTFQDTSGNREGTHQQTTDYIYLRKK